MPSIWPWNRNWNRSRTKIAIGVLAVAVVVVWGFVFWREFRQECPPCIIVGPAFTFQGRIVDGETGHPVTATVKVNGVVVLARVTECSITFPQNLDEFIVISAEAPGYERWALGFRPHGTDPKAISGTIRLRPKRYGGWPKSKHP